MIKVNYKKNYKKKGRKKEMVEPRIINNNFFSLLNNFMKGVKSIHLHFFSSQQIL